MTEEFRGPAAVAFDWVHIFERHTESGLVARQSGLKTLFSGLTEEQIKTLIRAAWKKRSRIKSQFDPLGVERILYQGTAPRSGQAIQFWYNVETKIVETAYPVRTA